MLTARSAMVSNSGTARAYPAAACPTRGPGVPWRHRPTGEAGLRRGRPLRLPRSAACSRVDGEHGRERVRVLRPLVRPVPLDAGEAQRDPARVARAALDAVEGDLDDELGAHVHDVALAACLELEQGLRLPGEHLVRQTLERLAQHDEAAALGVARPQV